jgi:hypothetical protein
MPPPSFAPPVSESEPPSFAPPVSESEPPSFVAVELPSLPTEPSGNTPFPAFPAAAPFEEQPGGTNKRRNHGENLRIRDLHPKSTPKV